MGNKQTLDKAQLKAYKNYPALIEEFSVGQLIEPNFGRLNLQFEGDLETVWKVQNKLDKRVYSLHERNKIFLAENKSQLNYVIRENRIVTTLSNRFILKVIYAFQTETELYMATEFTPLRLSHYTTTKKSFCDAEIRYLAASIILGLEYLRSKNILHRDIRPENIYLTQEGEIKLGGFLLAQESKDSMNNSTDCVGKCGYMAPEVISKKRHSFSADLYNLGIVLYELIAQQKLFKSASNLENLAKMETLNLAAKDFSSEVSDDLVDLINLLLQIDPKKRIGTESFDEIKSHRYFAEFDWDQLAAGESTPLFVPQEEERETISGDRPKKNLSLLRKSCAQTPFLGFQYGIGLEKHLNVGDGEELV